MKRGSKNSYEATRTSVKKKLSSHMNSRSPARKEGKVITYSLSSIFPSEEMMRLVESIMLQERYSESSK